MPRPARDSLFARMKTPLAIEAREIDVAGLKCLNNFRISGIGENPAASAREEAACIRKLCHLVEFDLPMQRDHALLAGMREQVSEHVLVELAPSPDLNDFPDRSPIDVVNVPTGDPAALVPEQRLCQRSPFPVALHERHQPIEGGRIVFGPEGL